MKNQFLAKEVLPQNIERHEICALSGKVPGVDCPHRKTELFLQGTYTTETCYYHQKIIVRDCHEMGDVKEIGLVVLPEKYKTFVDQYPSWSAEVQVSKICTQRDPVLSTISVLDEDKVAIVRPLPESIYAIDPHIPKRLQRLKLELNHFTNVKNVEWKNNGAALSGHEAVLDWPMEKGKHTFEAEVKFLNGRVEKTTLLHVTVL